MRRAAVLATITVLAGCGGQKASEPRLPRPLATAWQRQSDSVADALAAGDRCLAQRRVVALQASVIAAVNAHRLAPAFQEPLLGAVNELASRIGCPA
jgi:hypothetical protein